MDADLFGYKKDEAAIALLRKHESCALEAPQGRTDDHWGYHVAFSGGKDSVVMLDLVKRSGVDYKAYYNVTFCDPPELIMFIKQYHPEVKFIRPKLNMWDGVRKHGLPTRQARWCCRVMKESGGSGTAVATGIRTEESNARSKRRQVEQCTTKGGYMFIHPIFNWSRRDIWGYINSRGVPYCDLYNQGFERIGCVGCPNNRKVGESMERFPKIWSAWKRAAYDRWEAHESKRVPQRFPSAEAFWLWWLDRDSKKYKDDDQMGMFT